MTAPLGTASQPISSVVWIDRERLTANAWNPNHVAPPELDLLKTSIQEDGWTQPIVVGPTGDPDRFEVIDGFHRWTIAGDPEVWRLTDGLVPVVVLDRDEAERRLATIRHNRARGTHHVVKMADIVATLVHDMDYTEDEVRARLGMDREEVRRLLQRGNMLERGASPDGFGTAWRPAPKTHVAE